MVGALKGTLGGSPMSCRATGQDIELRVRPSPGALKAMANMRHLAIQFDDMPRRKLGLNLRVKVGPVTVAKRSL